MQGHWIQPWPQANQAGLSHSAAAPFCWCHFDSSLAQCWRPWTSWCDGSCTQGIATTGEPGTETWRQWRHRGGAEIYNHHPDVQPDRCFTQSPQPLPSSAPSPPDHHCVEQCRRANTLDIMELFGASSSSCGLQGTGQQSNAEQTAAFPWDCHWRSASCSQNLSNFTSSLWFFMSLLISSSAVLMLDDDILLSVPDISFAFSVWKVTNLNHTVMVVE